MPTRHTITKDNNNVISPALSVSEKGRLLAEIRALKIRIHELAQMADADPLVAVKNRRAFFREIERVQAIAARHKIPSCVVFFDLNNFKKINDQWGHNAGDDLLIKIGQALSANVRDSDMVARLGGDEFGVLLFKTEAKMAKVKAQELAEIISQVVIICDNDKISVSSAWGIAACDPNIDVKDIMAGADRNMYKNKTA